MLSKEADRYVALRRTLGHKLRRTARYLELFARFAAERDEAHIRTATAIAWAGSARTPGVRSSRLAVVRLFARFLRAENAAHEVPPANIFVVRVTRPIPYIYTQEEIAGVLDAAGQLRQHKPNPLRRPLYVMLFGLIAATGMRVSEALALRFDDILPGGTLYIRTTKFGKSRLVPLHETVIKVLDHYLETRRRLGGTSDLLFPSTKGKLLAASTVNYTFRCLIRRAHIAPDRRRTPRIHDLRHTFATRVLEQCSSERGAVARNFVTLSTYLGHVDISYTYWYLQATPELMTDISMMAEALIGSMAQ